LNLLELAQQLGREQLDGLFDGDALAELEGSPDRGLELGLAPLRPGEHVHRHRTAAAAAVRVDVRV
jgi:hypothetical protein